MPRLIDADVLYERACSLEAQALDYVGKLIERDGDKVSVEWRIWSAILAERTAFKHDVFDAPTIEERKTGEWVKPLLIMNTDRVRCSECSAMYDWYTQAQYFNFCPNCGVRLEN